MLELFRQATPFLRKIQIFSSVFKLDFPPFTNTLSSTLASELFFAFLTQTSSLQQEYYFQYKDESRCIFCVASPLYTSAIPFPSSPVVS